LAKALRDLLAPEPLLPAPPATEADATRDAAWHALQREFANSGAQLREDFNAAIRKRVLSNAKNKAIPVDALCDWLAAQLEQAPLRPHPQLARLTPAAIEDAYLKSSRAPSSSSACACRRCWR
jgi:exodeoxyribonuclease V beta subunit